MPALWQKRSGESGWTQQTVSHGIISIQMLWRRRQQLSLSVGSGDWNELWHAAALTPDHWSASVSRTDTVLQKQVNSSLFIISQIYLERLHPSVLRPSIRSGRTMDGQEMDIRWNQELQVLPWTCVTWPRPQWRSVRRRTSPDTGDVVLCLILPNQLTRET